ncbi:3-oxoacyl-(acyl-carrier-protein) reductase [Colletotrichum truncatum]|uniref:3-oxoacyl-(Acyl-carrier-protein) reductase n=1 Tax=Colletotrichum truncatum TaxID=5467 RepID=A0ACC3ZF98_COLTU|nr:3-oxoacyl-(acyl-carrier-protein) reductase [Colletotrichum truncatum]KAF6801699.1 3-oxoacyl-(acyl-carrier-protein) reductase [Colletotrichum truncatum]
MARSLEGKLGIVTGASRGIGIAIAENLASKGCNLVLGYTSPSSKAPAEQLAADLRAKHNIQALPVQADMGDPTGPRSLVETAKAHFQKDGKFQVDVIINNAGVAQNNLLPDVTIEQFDVSYRVNVLGPLLLVQAVQPYLPTDRSGRIVNMSSVSSSLGFPEQSVYGGTKAALEAMTRTWARELSENATVNAVNPGPVLTEMYASNTPEFKRYIKNFIEHTPLMRARKGIDSDELVADAEEAGGRPAYVGEIAGIVGMLVSAESAWCTGQVVCANGGMLYPFDDVLNLEEQFFSEGYRQGTEDGILAGKIEGRSVGLAKGYEKFLESGRIHGKSVVWANRLSLPQKTGVVTSSSDKEAQQQTPTELKTCSLPLLAPNARLEKNVTAAFALVEPDTLSTQNSDDAVNDFDDRFKRAQGKVKIIERMTGEGSTTKDATEASKSTEAKEH